MSQHLVSGKWQTLGVDIPGFGAEDVRVTVSADFFENPEVATALKNTLFIFKD